jgi:hypothetical protein
MALCRCLENHGWPTNRVRKYVGYLRPLGYPETSSICGLCDNPGVIWIEKEEELAYKNGQRIFDGANTFTKMMADDSGVFKRK